MTTVGKSIAEGKDKFEKDWKDVKRLLYENVDLKQVNIDTTNTLDFLNKILEKGYGKYLSNNKIFQLRDSAYQCCDQERMRWKFKREQFPEHESDSENNTGQKGWRFRKLA